MSNNKLKQDSLVNLNSQIEKISHDPLQSLTPREKEVFMLLADGLKNIDVAKKLFISHRTVETHRARIVRKLNLSSNGELIRYSIRNGLTIA